MFVLSGFPDARKRLYRPATCRKNSFLFIAMAIKAYVGKPRAGKSYEVVVNVILPALRQGRRVVSNIAGLNYEAMCQILYQEGLPQDRIGELVCVNHSEVEKPSFWLTDTDQETGTESFIRPGDLVALDEIWRFWKKRGDIHPRPMNFFRMHGHMPHPVTGLTCEIALITQTVRDINENIKDVVLETFYAVKNTKIGSHKSYIVHIFQHGSISKHDFIRTLPPRYYDSKYFPCYKSHSQQQEGAADAHEDNPDDRGNILKGTFFKVAIPLALLLLLPAFYFVWKFFHPVQVPDPSAPVAVESGSAQSVQVAASPPRLPVADDWRVVGWFQSDGSLFATLESSSGKIRLIQDPPGYKLSASGLEVVLPDGGVATPWTAFNKSNGVLQ